VLNTGLSSFDAMLGPRGRIRLARSGSGVTNTQVD
jgi:hypothetical protein